MFKAMRWIYVLAIPPLCLFASNARAQSEVPRFEAGVQLSALFLPQPIDEGAPGVGGRFTYNFNSHFGLEGELNHFPGGPSATLPRGMTLKPNFGETQGLFGLRAGYAFPGGGLFLKARPGFIYFSENSDVRGRGLNGLDHFAVDLGFVGMRYFRNHTYVRLDIGDTIVTYGGEQLLNPVTSRISRLGTVNNPQLSFGVGIHF